MKSHRDLAYRVPFLVAVASAILVSCSSGKKAPVTASNAVTTSPFGQTNAPTSGDPDLTTPNSPAQTVAGVGPASQVPTAGLQPNGDTVVTLPPGVNPSDVGFLLNDIPDFALNLSQLPNPDFYNFLYCGVMELAGGMEVRRKWALITSYHMRVIGTIPTPAAALALVRDLGDINSHEDRGLTARKFINFVTPEKLNKAHLNLVTRTIIRSLLARDASQPEVDAWFDRITASNLSFEDIFVQTAISSEFQARIAANSDRTVAERFIQAHYQTVYSRTGSQNEINIWYNSTYRVLRQQGKTRLQAFEQISWNFLSSDEYRMKMAQVIWRLYLRENPSPAKYNQLVADMRAGRRIFGVQRNVLGSAEYLASVEAEHNAYINPAACQNQTVIDMWHFLFGI